MNQKPNNKFERIVNLDTLVSYGNVLFYKQQSTAYEHNHKMSISQVMLWCEPDDKIEKYAKFGKFMKYGNVWVYPHQVKES